MRAHAKSTVGRYARLLTSRPARHLRRLPVGDRLDLNEPLRRFIHKVPGERFQPADGPASLSGVAIETEDATGLATAVAPLRLGGKLSETLPPFWE